MLRPTIRARFPGRFNADRQTLSFRYDPFVQALLWVTINQKYVNMADINITSLAERALPAQNATGVRSGEPIWDLIELLFFAYRDFVSDPDDVLAKFNFGRAHHRVLHFVNRHPGMKVADLLDVLKITKQSLGRVLKQLLDQGYIVQKEGENDRRQRLLYVTAKGEALAMKLAGLQTERIARALAELGPHAHDAARRFLTAMIDADGRDGVQKLIVRADRARLPRS
jgi:DNA-binding MarR family transcriptional regulator